MTARIVGRRAWTAADRAGLWTAVRPSNTLVLGGRSGLPPRVRSRGRRQRGDEPQRLSGGSRVVRAGRAGGSVDEVDQGGDRNPAEAADVDGADFAGGKQLVGQAAADAEPSRGFVDGQ